MPRSRSIFIQSDWVRRAWPRARTAPAARMAPPASSRFSVRVVLPASGCEMIAKVRRRAACAAGEMLMGGRVACPAGQRKCSTIVLVAGVEFVQHLFGRDIAGQVGDVRIAGRVDTELGGH